MCKSTSGSAKQQWPLPAWQWESGTTPCWPSIPKAEVPGLSHGLSIPTKNPGPTPFICATSRELWVCLRCLGMFACGRSATRDECITGESSKTSYMASLPLVPELQETLSYYTRTSANETRGQATSMQQAGREWLKTTVIWEGPWRHASRGATTWEFSNRKRGESAYGRRQASCSQGLSVATNTREPADLELACAATAGAATQQQTESYRRLPLSPETDRRPTTSHMGARWYVISLRVFKSSVEQERRNSPFTRNHIGI